MKFSFNSELEARRLRVAAGSELKGLFVARLTTWRTPCPYRFGLAQAARRPGMRPQEYDEGPHGAPCASTGVTLAPFPGLQMPFRGRGGHVQNGGLHCYPTSAVNKMGRINLTLVVPRYVPNLNGLAQRILDSEDPWSKQIWARAGRPVSWKQMPPHEYDGGWHEAPRAHAGITLSPFASLQIPFRW